ncbi:hypothetical protein CHISP_2688 [Chitinispirillum alkaliphilum]|nr:hypothetical protein CHISP_2688 [Chitinispirillum alkaliphilum]
MSQLAEYAATLHEKEKVQYPRELNSVQYPSKVDQLKDIRAVIFDVYGTLINYWRPGFETAESREQTLLESFREIAERFEMSDYLMKINPGESVEKTLADFYRGLIIMSHDKAEKKGSLFPEIKVEEVWNVIVLMLKRHGYDPQPHCPGEVGDFSRYLAFTYNFLSLGRELYPGVYETMEKLRGNQIVLGILSNAQFYTPIDLTLMLRDQSAGKADDYNEVFDVDLTFFSYEFAVAKPNQKLFRVLYDALYEMHIHPSQTVFVGNDLILDIEPAQAAGMKTAMFVGDEKSAYFHDKKDKIVPDISFTHFEELTSRISFHA